ncbi:MAG: DUF1553 domain-containing protein [Planctomycetaceae bacterium]
MSGPSSNRCTFMHCVWLTWPLIGLCLTANHRLAAAPPAGKPSESEPLLFFEKRVRPLLISRCSKCHSKSSRPLRAGLLLDHRRQIIGGGDTGSAFNAEDPDSSLLLEAIRYADDSLQMPPSGRLPQREIDILVTWVRGGLRMPDAADEGPPTGITIDEAREFWSFRPLRKLERNSNDSAGSRTPIDPWVFDRLKQHGLSVSEPADRPTLIRRTTFDLLGLPPSPAEVRAFLADDRPDAYPRLIDRLLSSPHYGERWGRYWLDVARYTDTTAKWLSPKNHSYRYRDWIVQAFNQDVPYDRFVRQQLAADFVAEASHDDLAALGFLGLSPTYWKELKLDPSVIKTIVADEWEERIDTVCRSFLGLTVACARCHDHKTDPVTREDYYALAGVFASTRLLDVPLVPESVAQQSRAAHKRVEQLEQRIKQLTAKKLEQDDRARQTSELQAQIQTIRETTEHYDLPMVHGVVDSSLFVLPDGDHKTRLEYRDAKPRDLPVLARGDPSSPTGPVIKRRFLEFFGNGSSQPFQHGSGRLELANAILNQATALVARVIVNRIWRHHFGRGLVDTPSNFGFSGSQPSHPQLLDHLATSLVEHKWSLKWLHRQILLSATYRQSSRDRIQPMRVDPENRWLWRMNRRRLSIEPWRDAMLAVGSALERRMGGPALALEAPNNRRRTIYGKVGRRDLNELLRLYDFPDPTFHSPGRAETITPVQQLFLLNSPFVQAQAGAIVESVAEHSPDFSERIRELYQRLFARPPQQTELHWAADFLNPDNDISQQNWALYVQVLLASSEFQFVD